MHHGKRLYVCYCTENPPDPREVAHFGEVVRWKYSDQHEFTLWNDPEDAGTLWYVVAAHTAEEALKAGDLLALGIHPDQQDYEFFHAQIRAGLSPSPDELPESEPCLLPRLLPVPW